MKKRTIWHQAAKRFLLFRAEDITEKLSFYKKRLDTEAIAINKEKKKLNRILKKFTKGMEEYDIDNVYDYYENEIELTFRFSPSLTYNSHFLLLYAFLESNMKGIVNQLEHIGYGELHNRNKAGVEQYKGYINKTRLFTFKSQDKDFNFIADCKKIRDKLIHAYGELTDTELEEIRGVLTKYGSINIRYNKFGIIDKRLVSRLSSTVSRILIPMINEIAKNLPDTRPE